METTSTRRIAIVVALTGMSLQAAHAQSDVLIGFLDGESKMRCSNRSMAR
jgi:hypothetical protein